MAAWSGRSRWWGTRVTVVSAIAALVALGGIALGAQPKPGASYKGKGKFCANNGPNHKFTACPGKKNKFSFHTSSDGAQVRKFKGTLGPLYCGGTKETLRIASMTVKSDGSFGDSFSVPNKVNGKTNGTAHGKVKGRFKGDGTKASVFYRVVIHFNNTPHSQDCGGQVKGTAHKK
jgi:hypothetical protein